MLRDADTKVLVRRSTETFSEYLEDWYKTKIDVTEQTLNGYKYLMEHHAVPAFGARRLQEITPQSSTRRMAFRPQSSVPW